MAGNYGLKYYKTFVNDMGNQVRLNVYMRGYPGDVWQKIGDFVSLRLQLDGSDDPTEPITKSILTFSMRDSVDKPDVSGVKYGDWKEFYTNDATLYRVDLLVDGNKMWSGYVTPDNWRETLEYRSEIVITARDGLGALQDYIFREEAGSTEPGLISLEELLTCVSETGVVSMGFANSYRPGADNGEKYLTSAGISVNEWLINMDAFQEGDTIYNVLESALRAMGMRMGYVGSGLIGVASLRYAPYYELGIQYAEDESPGIEFVRGGATLSYVAPYKKIVDEVKYDSEAWEPDLMEMAKIRQDAFYSYKIEGDISGVYEGTGSMGYVQDTAESRDGVTWSGVGLLNPSKNTGYVDKPLIACNDVASSVSPNYPRTNVSLDLGPVSSLKFRLAVNFDSTAYAIEGANTFSGTVSPVSGTRIKSLKWKLLLKTSRQGTIYNNGGEWIYTQDYDDPTVGWFERKESDGQGIDSLEISSSQDTIKDLLVYGNDWRMELSFKEVIIGAENTYAASQRTGLYCAVDSLSIESNDPYRLKSDVVTTVNDLKMNVLKKIRTDIAPLSRSMSLPNARVYTNAIYYKDSGDGNIKPLPYKAKWSGTGGVEEPLAAIRHKQLLMYNHDTQKTLEGDFILKPEYIGDRHGMYEMGSPVYYKNELYMVLSGTLDLITGVMEGALLRSFREYEELWGN